MFMLFLLARLLVYIELNFKDLGYNPGAISYKSNVPFYVSEIIIALLVSYILFSVSRVQMR